MNAVERTKLIAQIRHYLSHGFNTKEIGDLLQISQQMVSYYRLALKEAFLNDGVLTDLEELQ